MTQKPTSVRLDADLIGRLDKLGEAYERSRAWLIAEAVRRFLAEEEEINAKIEEGLKAAEEGRLIPHKEIMRRSKAHIDGLRRRSAAE